MGLSIHFQIWLHLRQGDWEGGAQCWLSGYPPPTTRLLFRHLSNIITNMSCDNYTIITKKISIHHFPCHFHKHLPSLCFSSMVSVSQVHVSIASITTLCILLQIFTPACVDECVQCMLCSIFHYCVKVSVQLYIRTHSHREYMVIHSCTIQCCVEPLILFRSLPNMFHFPCCDNYALPLRKQSNLHSFCWFQKHVLLR